MNIDLSTDYKLSTSENKYRDSINNNRGGYRKYTEIYLKGQLRHFIRQEQINTLKFLTHKRELFNEILSFETIDTVNCIYKMLESVYDSEEKITPNDKSEYYTASATPFSGF